MARALKALINVNALKHNLAKIRERAPHQKIMAMVKANAYGHGLVPVAKILKDVDAFGVACLEEAVELRQAGIQNRIVLMEGFYSVDELPLIVELDLELAIHHDIQVNALKNFNKPISVWIKINTGMNRLGFKPDKVPEVLNSMSLNSNLVIIGFITHFAKADEPDSPETKTQFDTFFSLVKDLPGEKSLANSAAILSLPQTHADWVRPGIALYGVSPFPNRIGTEEDLKPVMTLQSEIIAIQNLKAGEAVGYGGDYRCQKDTRIGIVAVGYGDGYPRLMPTGTPVLVNGQPVPLIGRVSMDMAAVDLITQPQAKVGDPIELWGPNLPVERIAAAVGTSAYELLTGLAKRVAFEWV